jgi:hypothetical protein
MGDQHGGGAVSPGAAMVLSFDRKNNRPKLNLNLLPLLIRSSPQSST